MNISYYRINFRSDGGDLYQCQNPNPFLKVSLIVFIVVFAACALFRTDSSYARQWYVEPGITVSFGHLTNPELIDDSDIPIAEEGGEEASSISPAQSSDQTFSQIDSNLSFVSQTATDILLVDLVISAGEYSDEVYDTNNKALDLEYEKPGENTDFQYGLSYSEETSFDSELEDSGIFISDLDRTAWEANVGVTSRFSELWTSNYALRYRDVSFSGGSGSTTDFSETVLSSTFSRQVSERTSYYVGAELLAYRPYMNEGLDTISTGTATDQDSVSLQFGVNYALTPRSTLDWSINPAYVDSEDDDGSLDRAQDSIGYSLTYTNTGFSDTFSLSLSSAQESTSLGGISETTRGSFSWTHNFSERLATQVGFEHSRRDAVAGSASSDLSTISLGALWQARRNTHLELEYRHRTREESDIIETDARSNLFQVSLRYYFNRSRVFGSN